MQNFIIELKRRNESLFYFGLVCAIGAVVCLLLSQISDLQVYNVSAWYKPFKFAVSIALYSWTMGWYCFYLKNFNLRWFNNAIIILLGFEIIYIVAQAARGELSHFNQSNLFYTIMYVFMALGASLTAIYTAYVGWLFFKSEVKELPNYYLWGIRSGIIIFVVFAFEGFVMGSKLTHTIGGADGGEGLPLLNWSTKFGDPRIAHFIGMHALQVLPILAFYWFKNTKITIITAFLYAALAVFTLVQALQGRPLFTPNTQNQYGTIK